MRDDMLDDVTFMTPTIMYDTASDGQLPARWRRGSPERNSAACMLKRMRAGLDRRTRKVRRLRAAIRVGVYENDLKLHIAMDRMLADFGA